MSIDYPRAWQVADKSHVPDHDTNCSYIKTAGGIVCDCEVITKHKEYLSEHFYGKDGKIIGMRTNKEKYNFYRNKIKESDREFVELNKTPAAVVYQINYVKVNKFTVTNISYFRKPYTFANRDKPTREDVNRIKNLYISEEYLNRNKDLISYYCSDEFGGGFMSKLGEINKKTWVFFNKLDAVAKFEAINKQKDTDNDKIASDKYFKCTYCNKVTSIKDKYSGQIFYIRDNTAISEYMDFCSPSCSGMEQMSREG